MYLDMTFLASKTSSARFSSVWHDPDTVNNGTCEMSAVPRYRLSSYISGSFTTRPRLSFCSFDWNEISGIGAVLS